MPMSRDITVESADPFEPAATPTPTLASNNTPADAAPTAPSGARATDEGLWWATIAMPDDTANPAFAHLGPDEGGKLYTEVAGDYYLPEPARLDDTQRAKLRDLGWADPVADLSGDDEIQPRNHTRS